MSSTDKNKREPNTSQAPKFDWPVRRKHIAFYETERLRYLSAGLAHSPFIEGGGNG